MHSLNPPTVIRRCSDSRLLESHEDISMTFYGSSFITDHQGELLVEASRDQQEIITASLDLDVIRGHRASWGLFRDRRTDLYQQLLSLDGSVA